MSADTLQSEDNSRPEVSSVDDEAMYQLMSGIDPVIRPLIPMFLEQSQLRIDSMDESCASADFISIKKTAHTMKGSAASYGFTTMASLARDIEDVLRSEPVDVPALVAMIRSLRDLYVSARKVVENHPSLFQEN
jgi:HPt (histidine-containing phosphotransfer) domain-containing protein